MQVLLDEAYVEYNRGVDQPDQHALLAEYPNLAVCRTFSKAYGLAGLRLGYMVGAPEFIKAVNKVGIPFGVNALSQVAGVASLETQSELMLRVDETVAQRARVEELIAELCGADGTVDTDGETGSDGAASAETTAESSGPRSAGPAEPCGSRSVSLAVPSQANFVWLPLGNDAQRFDEAMKDEDIVARCFPGEGVRVTVTNEEETERLIAALKKVLPEFV